MKLEDSCLTEIQIQEVKDRLREWKDFFASSPLELGKLKSDNAPAEKHHIQLNDPTLFKEKTA